MYLVLYASTNWMARNIAKNRRAKNNFLLYKNEACVIVLTDFLLAQRKTAAGQSGIMTIKIYK
jgi:hypothetical protein